MNSFKGSDSFVIFVSCGGDHSIIIIIFALFLQNVPRRITPTPPNHTISSCKLLHLKGIAHSCVGYQCGLRILSEVSILTRDNNAVDSDKRTVTLRCGYFGKGKKGYEKSSFIHVFEFIEILYE